MKQYILRVSRRYIQCVGHKTPIQPKFQGKSHLNIFNNVNNVIIFINSNVKERPDETVQRFALVEANSFNVIIPLINSKGENDKAIFIWTYNQIVNQVKSDSNNYQVQHFP